MRDSMATRPPLVPEVAFCLHRAGSTGPLSWKERDRVRCGTSSESSHTSPQPSSSRRGSPLRSTPARWVHEGGGVA
jgi:hypothetical protein